jgi:hypothetical protein
MSSASMCMPCARGKRALAPRAQEIALAIEHDDRMLAAIERVDAVLAVDRDRRDVLELQPSGASPSSRRLDSGARRSPGPLPWPRATSVSRILAIQDPHHRLEEQRSRSGARWRSFSARRLHLRDDLVGKHLQRQAGAQRQHLRAADALELVEAAIRLPRRRPSTSTPWFFMNSTCLSPITRARRSPLSTKSAVPS